MFKSFVEKIFFLGRKITAAMPNGNKRVCKSLVFTISNNKFLIPIRYNPGTVCTEVERANR